MHDYIIKIEKAYNETFKTESGLELYGDKRFNSERLANRIAEVIETPALKDSIIKKGFEVMVDPTIFLKQTYERHAENDNIFLQDAKNGLYKIEPSMIVLYRETKQSEWKAFGDNILVEPIKKEAEEKKDNSIIIELEKSKYVEGIAKIKFINSDLLEDGCKNNDVVAIKSGFGVSFWIDGKEFHWIKNRHVLVVINQN